MFDTTTYLDRRKKLKKQVQSGIVLFLGNDESTMNYMANTYHYRQDSSFLYYWGLDFPGFAALIDLDEGSEIIFGNDFTVDDIIWMGPQATIAGNAVMVGVNHTESIDKLAQRTSEALQNGRRVHYLPQYRHDNLLKMERITGIHNTLVNSYASKEFIKAVIAQRSIKSDFEIEQIEAALEISYDINLMAMQDSKPGIYEKEIAGRIEGYIISKGSIPSFPIIFSIHGETLHNHLHENLMKKGDLLVLDSGAESALHYASDITRTFPVSKKFTTAQREIYEVVLRSQLQAIEMIQPGIFYRDVHLHVAKVIAEGMKALGFMKGNMDEAVATGAHALFFPHGLGHMLGLDVHDMESLGEKYIGYTDELKRSEQFGLAYLRFAKTLQPGHVITVEPGIYFIPELIDQWKGEKKHKEFINYAKVESYKKFGGIRIEDDVLVTKRGNRVLGACIPKTIQEIEETKNNT